METKDFILEVGGEKINLAASGKAQLVRLSRITKFIDIYGKTAVKSIQTRDGENVDMLGRCQA
mgnify:CR=1 FL=1